MTDTERPDAAMTDAAMTDAAMTAAAPPLDLTELQALALIDGQASLGTAYATEDGAHGDSVSVTTDLYDLSGQPLLIDRLSERAPGGALASWRARWPSDAEAERFVSAVRAAEVADLEFEEELLGQPVGSGASGA